jgi:hypothetical protein
MAKALVKLPCASSLLTKSLQDLEAAHYITNSVSVVMVRVLLLALL